MVSDDATCLCNIICACSISSFPALAHAREVQHLVGFDRSSCRDVCVWLVSPVSYLYEWRHVSGDENGLSACPGSASP